MNKRLKIVAVAVAIVLAAIVAYRGLRRAVVTGWRGARRPPSVACMRPLPRRAALGLMVCGCMGEGGGGRRAAVVAGSPSSLPAVVAASGATQTFGGRHGGSGVAEAPTLVVRARNNACVVLGARRRRDTPIS